MDETDRKMLEWLRDKLVTADNRLFVSVGSFVIGLAAIGGSIALSRAD